MIQLLTFLLSLSLFPNQCLGEINANEIVKKADLKRGLGNVSHSFDVTISNQDDKIETFHVSFQDMTHSLTEQTSPERSRGRKLLMRDYDIWLFTPNIKKALRISLEQKLTGQVSNGDIARTNYYEDYEATSIPLLATDPQASYRLSLIAKNKKVTYGKIEYLVSKKDYAPISATFYALSGKALKQATFSEFKLIYGVTRATKMVIQDFLQKHKISTMIFKNHKPEKFNNSLFNKDRLEF